jgi:hypothetical protein
MNLVIVFAQDATRLSEDYASVARRILNMALKRRRIKKERLLLEMVL